MRGFLKRILGGLDEVEQACDMATGNWAPVPATMQRPDWGSWLEEEAEELELEPEDELTPVQLLAAETLAAQARRRRSAQTGPQQPVARAASSMITGPQPRMQPLAVAAAPAMPVTGPQPRIQPPPVAAAPMMPVTGPQPRVAPPAVAAAPAPTPAATAAGSAPTSAQVLAYLSPEERAIVEAQRESNLPQPPTTRARFVSAPVATCARHAGTTRPSHPRLPVVNPRPRRQLRAMPPVGAQTAIEPAVASPAPETHDWTTLLKAYGEHLTDEELLVLRSQLS